MVGQCLSLDVHVYVDVDDVHDDYDVHVFLLDLILELSKYFFLTKVIGVGTNLHLE